MIAGDPISGFVDDMAGNGLSCPDIVADGCLHRFHVDGDKPGSRNGWYVLHWDRFPAGAYGSWKDGITITWCQRKPTNPEERKQRRQALDAIFAKRREAQDLRHREAADKARRLWSESVPALFHPYLQKKKILPHGIRQRGDALVIPIYVDGGLTSLQFISPDGAKRFLSGGKIRGGYYPIGKPADRLYVAEGLATGATIHQHIDPHQPVAVAFNAGNLKTVAQYLRRRHPKTEIIIAADNDSGTDGNPGLSKAREAASAVGAELVYPEFDDEPFDGTDFNDLYVQGGAAR